jgi:hypothetical protein
VVPEVARSELKRNTLASVTYTIAVIWRITAMAQLLA